MISEEYISWLESLGVPAVKVGSGERGNPTFLNQFLLNHAGQWSYPHDKPSGIVLTPPHRLVAKDSMTQFIPTLDVVSLTKEEWGEALSGFLDTARDNHIRRTLQ